MNVSSKQKRTYEEVIKINMQLMMSFMIFSA